VHRILPFPRPPWAIALCFGLLVGGLSLAVPGAAQEMINPVAATEASLARGREIYASSCAICHGVQGRGDGPLARTMVPRPSDFRLHMIEGHTDAQLFEWVSNGVPETAMQGFATQLSEEDRWNVINYLQTFAAAGQ
jgi:mono/diheme cytochrome c family protein